MGQVDFEIGQGNGSAYPNAAVEDLLSRYNFQDLLSKYGVYRVKIIFSEDTGSALAHTVATSESGLATITVRDSIYQATNGEAYIGIQSGPNATIGVSLAEVLLHEFCHAAFPGIVNTEFHNSWQRAMSSVSTNPIELGNLLQEFVFFGLESSIASELGMPVSFNEQQKFFKAREILSSESSFLRKEISGIDWENMSPLDMLNIMRDPTHPIHKYLKVDLRPGIALFAIQQGQYEHCFLAGTQIELFGGGSKPIEEIDVGDIVSSFHPGIEAGRGQLVPGRVRRLFKGTTPAVVNLRGLRTTPGHVFLCGDGFMKTIAKILHEDSTIVKKNGEVIRARTGNLVNEDEDRLIYISYNVNGEERLCGVRAGIPIGNSARNRGVVTLLDLCREQKLIILDCGLVSYRTSKRAPVRWPANGTPYDSVPQENYVVVGDDGSRYVPRWIAALQDYDSDNIEMNALRGSLFQ